MEKELLQKLGITDESITDEKIVEFVLSTIAQSKGEYDKVKDLLSKRNGEIAEFKRQADAKKSDEEKHQEYVAKLEQDFAELQKKQKESEIKTNFLSLGYSEEEAKKMALACMENNYGLVAKYTNEHAEKIKAELKAELLKNVPQLQGGQQPNNTIYTKENFRAGKISYDELCNLQTENPALFDAITK